MAKSKNNVFRTDRGYWVRIPKAKAGSYNAWLTSVDGKTHFPLWVYALSTDFSLTGSTAQSQKTRTFFPRNFSQPALGVRGQTFDQQMYRDLAEFIRAQQMAALRLGRAMGLTIPRAGNSVAGKQRGPRDGISAEGYVLGIQTGGAFGEFHPEYEFAFTISRSRAGILGWDKAATRHKLNTWADIFKNMNKATGFVNDPDNDWLDNLLEDRDSPSTEGGH